MPSVGNQTLSSDVIQLSKHCVNNGGPIVPLTDSTTNYIA